MIIHPRVRKAPEDSSATTFGAIGKRRDCRDEGLVSRAFGALVFSARGAGRNPRGGDLVEVGAVASKPSRCQRYRLSSARSEITSNWLVQGTAMSVPRHCTCLQHPSVRRNCLVKIGRRPAVAVERARYELSQLTAILRSRITVAHLAASLWIGSISRPR